MSSLSISARADFSEVRAQLALLSADLKDVTSAIRVAAREARDSGFAEAPMAALRSLTAQQGTILETTSKLNKVLKESSGEMAEGFNAAKLAASGTVREFVIMGHEALIMGNYNRLAGSAVVLLGERLNLLPLILGSVKAALLSPWMPAVAGAVAVTAAVGYLTIEALEAQSKIQGTADALTFLGRATADTVQQLTAMRDHLAQSFSLSTSDAAGLVDVLARMPGVAGESADAIARIAVAVAKVKDEDLPKAAEEAAGEANKGGKAFLDWAEKIGFKLSPALKENIQLLEDSDGKIASARSAISALSQQLDTNVGAWQRATAAVQQFIGMEGEVSEYGGSVAAQLGMHLPATLPAAHPPVPPPPSREGTLQFGPSPSELAAIEKDAGRARAINLDTRIRETKEIGTQIALIRQKFALEVSAGKLGPQEAKARADAEISTAERADQRKAGGGRGGGGAAKGIADETATWREQLQRQLEAERNFFGDSTAEELKFWQAKIGLTRTGSKEQAQIASTVYQLQKRQAQEGLRADEEAESRKESLDRAYLTAFERSMKLLAAQKQITTKQALGFDIEYTAKVEEEEKKRLQAFIADDRLTLAEKQQYYERLIALEAEMGGKIVEFQTQAATASANTWKEGIKQISDSFASTLTDIITRTKSTKEALDELIRSLVKDTLESGIKGLFSSLLFGSGGTGSGAGAGGGGSGGGGIAGGLFSSLGGGILKSLGGDAASGLVGNPFTAGAGGLLGGLFAGGSEISTATDFAGGAAGAGAGGLFSGIGSLFAGLTKLLAFSAGGVVPSAAGGWVVPSFANGGILSMLHQNEMVLPANISQSVQDMASGGGGHTFNFNIATNDGASVAKWARANAPALVAAINHGIRNGSPMGQG